MGVGQSESKTKGLDSCRDFPEFLRRLRTTRGRRGVPQNYAQVARMLGYRSPRSIAMVEKNQRAPSAELIDRITQKLNFSDLENKYLQLLALQQRMELKREPTQGLRERLQLLRARLRKPSLVSEDHLRLLSDWEHLAIYGLVPGPRPWTADEIAAKLRGKVSASRARQALQRMKAIGMIQEDSPGHFSVVREGHLMTQPDQPSRAAQEHHRQMLERAAEALSETLTHQRDFNSLCLRFRADRLPEAKKMIEQFYFDFENRFCDDAGEEVFELLLHFFPLTRLEGKSS